MGTCQSSKKNLLYTEEECRAQVSKVVNGLVPETVLPFVVCIEKGKLYKVDGNAGLFQPKLPAEQEDFFEGKLTHEEFSEFISYINDCVAICAVGWAKLYPLEDIPSRNNQRHLAAANAVEELSKEFYSRGMKWTYSLDKEVLKATEKETVNILKSSVSLEFFPPPENVLNEQGEVKVNKLEQLKAIHRLYADHLITTEEFQTILKRL